MVVRKELMGHMLFSYLRMVESWKFRKNGFQNSHSQSFCRIIWCGPERTVRRKTKETNGRRRGGMNLKNIGQRRGGEDDEV